MTRRARHLGVLTLVALGTAPVSALAQRPRESARTAEKGTSFTIDMVVGEHRTIPSADVESLSVGTPGIVDVKPTPDASSLIIVGQHAGTTTILLIKNNGQQVTYNVNVSSRNLSQVEQELEQLLAEFTGLRIRKVGTRFFIEGGVATDADARRIGLIAGLYPGQVESLVVVGSVGIEHTINIRIDVYFVQYNKTSDFGVGINYPTSIGPPQFDATLTLPTGAGTSTVWNASAAVDQALPALDIAQTRGWAKVLKHAAVVTTSGSEASFSNGGEINFAVAAGLTGTIQAIKYGTNLTIMPRYDSQSHDLEVKVKADISDLTPAASASSLPGRQTAGMDTFVHMKLGQSIVLSGIRTWSEQNAVAGIPILSEIPVLGWLFFGSWSNSESDTEGALYIIPSIIESVPRRAYDITDTAMRQYEDYSGNIRKMSSFPEPPPSYQ